MATIHKEFLVQAPPVRPRGRRPAAAHHLWHHADDKDLAA